VHEIEWENGEWSIETEDIEYEWLPFDPAQTTDMELAEKQEKDKAVYQSLHEGKTGVFTESYGFIGVAGTEAVMFLNGLITNDVAKLEENSWMPAAFPNAQGRLLATVRVLRQHDKFLFVTERATYEKVLKNLERFTLAGDFQVNDSTEKLQMLSIRGKQALADLSKIPE
jgi:folate-binding Fe-S cluster repair protein YgfZ